MQYKITSHPERKPDTQKRHYQVTIPAALAEKAIEGGYCFIRWTADGTAKMVNDMDESYQP